MAFSGRELGGFSSAKQKYSIGTLSKRGRPSFRESLAKPLFPSAFRSSGPEQLLKLPTDSSQCADIVSQFLTNNNYNKPLSMKILYTPNGPNTNQFLSIFEFIYNFVDLQFTVTPKTILDDVVLKVFKSLNYPYPMNKSQFKGIGTQHGWRPTLPALSWLCNLVTNYFLSDWTIKLECEEEFNEDIQLAIYNYQVKTYQFVKESKDDFSQLDEELADQLRCEDVNEISKLCEERKVEIAVHQAKLAENDSQRFYNEELRKDVAHMSGYLMNKKAYLVTLHSQSEQLESQIQLSMEKVQNLKEDMRNAEVAVASQKMTLQDVEALKAEAAKLATKIAAKRKLLEQQKKCTWSREMNLASCKERVSDVIEKIYSAWKPLADHLGSRISELDLEKLASQSTLPTDTGGVNFKKRIEKAFTDLNDRMHEVSLKLISCKSDLQNKEEQLKLRRRSAILLESKGNIMDDEYELVVQQLDADWQEEKNKLEEMVEELKKCQSAIGELNVRIVELKRSISELRKIACPDVNNKKAVEIKAWLDGAKQVVQDGLLEVNTMLEELATNARANAKASAKRKGIVEVLDTEVESACGQAHHLIEHCEQLRQELNEVLIESARLRNCDKK